MDISKNQEGHQTAGENTTYAALDLQMPPEHSSLNASHMIAASVYILTYKQQQMKYIHQSFYNMPILLNILSVYKEVLTYYED